MQLFKQAKKPKEAAHPPQDGFITSVPPPASNSKTDAEVGTEKNPIGLTRTRTEDIVYPSGLKLVLLMSSVFLSMFLVALVRGLSSLVISPWPD